MIKTFLGLLFKKLRNQINLAISYHDKKSFLTKNSHVHSSFKLGIDNVIFIDPTAKIDIDKGVTINQNNFITIKSNAKLKIGAETYITRATISCLGEIEIGENCILGEGMKLFDHNHQYSKNPFFHDNLCSNVKNLTCFPFIIKWIPVIGQIKAKDLEGLFHIFRQRSFNV